MARGKGIPAFPQPNRERYDAENEAEFRRMILEALSDLGSAVSAAGEASARPPGWPEFISGHSEGENAVVRVGHHNHQGDEKLEVWLRSPSVAENYRAAIAESAPVAWFEFSEDYDDPAGQVMVDSSGNGYHGTYQDGQGIFSDPCSDDNVPAFTEGPWEGSQALYLSGPDSRARAARASGWGVLSPATLEFIARPEATSSGGYGFGGAGSSRQLWEAYEEGSVRAFTFALGTNRLYGIWSGPSDLGDFNFYEGDLSGWRHYAITLSGKTVTLFLDGVQVAQVTASGADENLCLDPTLRLGKRLAAFDNCDASPDPFVGAIAQWAMYDRVLTEDEIEAHAAAFAAPVSGGLWFKAAEVDVVLASEQDVLIPIAAEDAPEPPPPPVDSIYSEAVLADEPVLYYRLGEPSGAVAVDATGNENDGTYVNSPTLGATGAILTEPEDDAVSFDGTNDYLSVPTSPLDAFAAATERTLEFWVKTTESGAVYLLGTVNEGSTTIFRVRLNTAADSSGASGSTQVYFRDEGGDVARWAWSDSQVDIYDGGWHHVVIAQEAALTLVVYVDGQEVSLTTAHNGTYDNPGAWDYPLVFGALNNRGVIENYAEVVLDEIALYDYALSEERIQAHYWASKKYRDVVLADEPAGYWPLDEESGTTAADESGNENDGTYVGGPTLDQSPLITSGRAAEFAPGTEVLLPNQSAIKPSLPISMECWFQLTSTELESGEAVVLIANDSTNISSSGQTHAGVALGILAVDRISCFIGDASGTGATSRLTFDASWTLDTEKHHVVLVVTDTSTVQIYLDGVALNPSLVSGTGSGLGYTSAGGSIANDMSNDADVVLDEVAIYDYALSEEQVQAHYVAGGGTL